MKDLTIRRALSWINVIVILFLVLWMSLITASVLSTQAAVAEFNENQIVYVQQQNEAQLCAQADIVEAVRLIGLRLGLPVDDIVVPDVEGLSCATD
jgi:hypothetical protein